MAQDPDRGAAADILPTGLMAAGLLDLAAFASATAGNNALTLMCLVDSSAIMIGTGAVAIVREHRH